MEAPLGKDPDQRNYIVSNAKIENLGFQPRVSLKNGLEELTKGLPMFLAKSYTNI
jgi:nucleoside-diphosphate-sugar epimerase